MISALGHADTGWVLLAWTLESETVFVPKRCVMTLKRSAAKENRDNMLRPLFDWLVIRWWGLLTVHILIIESINPTNVVKICIEISENAFIKAHSWLYIDYCARCHASCLAVWRSTLLNELYLGGERQSVVNGEKKPFINSKLKAISFNRLAH